MGSLDKTLSTMVEISKIVTSSNDFFAIKDLVIDKMLEIVPPKKACVNIFKNNTYEYTYLVCKETLGDIPKHIKGEQTNIGLKIPIRLFPKYIEEAVLNKKVYYVKNVFEDENAKNERQLAKVSGYVGRVVFPLISSDKVKGFMTCFLEDGEELTDENIKFIDSVASLLALSVDITNRNKDIDDIIRKLRDAIISIESLADNLYENKGLDLYFKLISEDICKITNSKSSIIFINDEDSDIRIIESSGNITQLKEVAKFLSKADENGKKIYKRSNIPKKLLSLGVRSIAYENLVKDDKTIGKIILINAEKYYMDDLRILGIYSTQIILSVYIYINNRKILENSMIHRDLQLVNQQQKLIMEDEIMIEDDFLKIDYLNIPYKYIGGDFCKFKKVGDGKYILFIADVMGHGIMSNYFVAMMKGAINLLLTMTSSPSTILSQLNKILFKELDKLDVFITAKMIFFDFHSNCAYSSNAGHTMPIVIYKDEDNNRKYKLIRNNTAIAIGIFEDTVYQEDMFSIEDVELFAIYTDGIIESKNDRGEEFGVDNLANYLIQRLNKQQQTLCDGIPLEIEKFTNKKKIEDDITIFTMRKK